MPIKKICYDMSIAASFKHRKQKSIICWLVDNLWYKHTMRILLRKKNNELLICTIWMNLKSIIISELSQTQTLHTIWSHLYEIIGEAKLYWHKANECLSRAKVKDSDYKRKLRMWRGNKNALSHSCAGICMIAYIC